MAPQSLNTVLDRPMPASVLMKFTFVKTYEMAISTFNTKIKNWELGNLYDPEYASGSG